MSSIELYIYDGYYEYYVKRIEVLQKLANEGIGQISVLLDNSSGIFTNKFPGDAVIVLWMDGQVFFRGYVDNVVPVVQESKVAHAERTLMLTGRSVGQDLMNKLYDKVYVPQPINTILQNILTLSGSEINVAVKIGVPPTIYYDSRGEFNIDSVRTILELAQWEGRVNNSKYLDIFPIGEMSSGITIKMVAGAQDNNVIDVLEHTEKDTFELKNYIIVFGDKVDDGWSEANAADLACESGNVLLDYYETDVKKGAAAIEVSKGTSGDKINLIYQFPLYNKASLDFRKLAQGEMSFQFKILGTLPPDGKFYPPSITLTDSAGTRINFAKSGGVGSNYWDVISAPLGKNVEIKGPVNQDSWSKATAGQPDFNWNVVKIEIWITGLGQPDATDLVIDGLVLPVQMVAVAYDNDSIFAYKKRVLPLFKKDINSQIELNAFANSVLQKRKDPLEKLKLSVRGDAGLIIGIWKWWPGYTSIVNIPMENLNNAVFRMIQIRNVFEREGKSGWDHTAELFLVPQYAKLETQRWTYGGDDSKVAILRNLRDRVRYFEQQEIEVRDWYQSLPKPFWELYGLIPSKGIDVNLPQDNMLLNANFELDTDHDGIPDNWELYTVGSANPFFRSDLDTREGGYSMRINPLAEQDWTGFFSDYIPVQEGWNYVGRVLANANHALVELILQLDWYNAGKGFIGSSLLKQSFLDSWAEYSGYATAPTNARYAKFFVCVRNMDVGSSRIANVDSAWMFKQITWLDLFFEKLKQEFMTDQGGRPIPAENTDYYGTGGSAGGYVEALPPAHFRLHTGITGLPPWQTCLENVLTMSYQLRTTLECVLRVSHTTQFNGYASIGAVYEGAITACGFGFHISNGTIYGVSQITGNSRTTLSLGSAPANTWIRVKAHYTPGVGVDFWRDGVYYGNITTNLPNAEMTALWTHVRSSSGIEEERIFDVLAFSPVQTRRSG